MSHWALLLHVSVGSKFDPRKISDDLGLLTSHSYPVSLHPPLLITTLMPIVPQPPWPHNFLNICRQRYCRQKFRADSMVSTVLCLYRTRRTRCVRPFLCTGTSCDMLAKRRTAPNISPHTCTHNIHRLSTSSAPCRCLRCQSTYTRLRRARRERRLYNPRRRAQSPKSG